LSWRSRRSEALDRRLSFAAHQEKDEAEDRDPDDRECYGHVLPHPANVCSYTIL
jgi:hypothetical protein